MYCESTLYDDYVRLNGRDKSLPFLSENTSIKLYHIFLTLGGPDGELSASLRYLNQRYVMPYSEVKGLLTDIGTEESAHQRYMSIFQ